MVRVAAYYIHANVRATSQHFQCPHERWKVCCDVAQAFSVKVIGGARTNSMENVEISGVSKIFFHCILPQSGLTTCPLLATRLKPRTHGLVFLDKFFSSRKTCPCVRSHLSSFLHMSRSERLRNDTFLTLTWPSPLNGSWRPDVEKCCTWTVNDPFPSVNPAATAGRHRSAATVVCDVYELCITSVDHVERYDGTDIFTCVIITCWFLYICRYVKTQPSLIIVVSKPVRQCKVNQTIR